MATTTVSLAVVCVALEAVLLDDLRTYLRHTAEIAAAQIDGDRHLQITRRDQTGSPEYLALSAPLAVLLQTNPDIRFAYTGVVRGGTMHFVLDGDRSADRAVVLQEDVPTPGELELARSSRTFVEDRPSPTAWGIGIRAYAPLAGSAGRAGAYVGITMSADGYYSWVRRVYHTAALGWLLTLLLAVVAAVWTARVEGTRLRAEAEIAAALQMATDAADARREIEARSHGRQKLEALGTLAGGVAHDFNNMLTVILGHADIMAGSTPDESGAGASAEAIRTAALRARDVVRRILLFSRPQTEGQAAQAVEPVLDETVQLLAASMPSCVSLVWRPPSASVSAIIDPTQLGQVLLNLGVNASQALPEGRGTIEFRLAQVEIGPIESTRLGLLSGPHACIEVRDDGSGMTEEVRSRIFEPFFTTKPAGTGTGLGLSVVEGIVRSHRGTIEVQSAPGAGTTFRLYLPATQRAAEVRRAAPATAPVGAAGRRILLVDDEPMVLKVHAAILRRAGYNVEAHGDVESALTALALAPAHYDGLVTDRTMPTASGLELAARARGLRPGLPIVLLTGNSEPCDAESPHISVVLTKPATGKALAEAIERAISRSVSEGAPGRGGTSVTAA